MNFDLATMAACVAILPFAASAMEDKYAITAEEHAACDADAVNLCSDFKPDENSLIACMRTKRNQLSPACLMSFTAGMQKRHVPL